VWDDRAYLKLQSLTRQLLAENDVSPAECMVAFKQFDRDGDGVIDKAEFDFFVTTVRAPSPRTQALPIPCDRQSASRLRVSQVLGFTLTQPELARLWSRLDANLSGAVNYIEVQPPAKRASTARCARPLMCSLVRCVLFTSVWRDALP
jgi:Ca2+-binding EF-hand superfamily protein